MDMAKTSQSESRGRFFNLLTFCLVLSTYFLLYGSFIICCYAVFTLNVPLIITLTIVSIIQIPLAKNQWFTGIVGKYSHPSRFFKSFKFINDTDDPPKYQKCLYAFHPHSIYASGLLCSMNNPDSLDFKDMVGISSNFILMAPFIGLLFRSWGVASASNHSIKNLMKQGKKIGLLPGGFQEATITSANQMRCWISRKGFVKYSLQYDYEIVPVMILGEHRAFWTFEGLQRLRLFINRLKVPGVLYWNKWTGVIMPSSVEFTIIRGRTISCRHNSKEEISSEQINNVHRQYVQQIQRLHSKYKHLNGEKGLKFY